MAGGIGTTLGQIAATPLLSKRSKFRTPQLPSLSELSNEAVKAQEAQLIGSIQNLDQFGGAFIGAQRAAQKQALPGFFEQNRQGIQQGEDLIQQLMGGAGLRNTAQQVRASQAARGVALSGASAIEEGLAVSERDLQNQFRAFGLRSQLAQQEAATPLGLQAFNPGITGLGQLVGTGAGLAGQQAGIQSLQQQIKIQQADASRHALASGIVASGSLLDQTGVFGKQSQDSAFGTQPTTTQGGGTQPSGGGSEGGGLLTSLLGMFGG